MNSSTFTTIDPCKMVAWGAAVYAQYDAQGVGTAVAWAEAARAWDTLAQLYPPSAKDRDIYLGLARSAWLKAANA